MGDTKQLDLNGYSGGLNSMGTFTPDTGNSNTGATPEWNAFLQNAESNTSHAGNPPAAASAGPTPARALPQHAPDNDPQGYSAFMAPWMAQAHQIFGQNPVFGNAAWANNTRVGRGLTAGIEALSQARPGATLADSLGVAAREFMAPEQIKREQALNEQNYVNQRTQQYFGIQKDLSQINENNARTAYMSGAQNDLAEARADRLNNPPSKTHFGSVITDPTTNLAIQPEYDSATGMLIRSVPLPGQSHGIKTGNANEDFTLSGIQRRLDDPDPNVRAKANDDLATYTRTNSTIAGGRAGAIQGAEQPQKDEDKFLANEFNLFKSSQEPAMTRAQFDEAHKWDTDYLTPGGPDKLWSAQQTKDQAARSDRNASWTDYYNSGAVQQKVGYAAWQKAGSPKTYGNAQSRPTQANQATASQPWHPPTN